MSDDRKKAPSEKTLSRRKILAGAAGVAAAAAGSGNAQASTQERAQQRPQRQDFQPIGRQPTVQRIGNSTAMAELQVERNLRPNALSPRVARLLQDDLMLRGEEYSRSMELINSVLAKAPDDYSGVIVLDLNGSWEPGRLGVPGGVSQNASECTSNSCGIHSCGEHTCGAEGCTTQGCGGQTCTSNTCTAKDCSAYTSFSGELGDIRNQMTAQQRVWNDLAVMHRQYDAMNRVEVRINHRDAARIRTDMIRR
jgi:hypothetical protein